MRFLPLLIVAALFGLTGRAEAATCYVLTLKDEKGEIIPVDPPPIGFMLNGNPIIGDGYPPHAVRDVRARVKCPEALVNGFRDLYNESCTSEERRQKAVEANRSTIEVVLGRCNALADALQSDDADFARARANTPFPEKK